MVALVGNDEVRPVVREQSSSRGYGQLPVAQHSQVRVYAEVLSKLGNLFLGLVDQGRRDQEQGTLRAQSGRGKSADEELPVAYADGCDKTVALLQLIQSIALDGSKGVPTAW